MACLVAVITTPVWAGEPETFDPDQPFNQVRAQRFLQALLHEAFDAFDEHMEISGHLDPASGQGERRQTLRFKFYPEGKSRSDRHVTAEGWVGPSQDSREQEFHFRFALPRSSAGPSPEAFDQVL
jgi:hypothetical protein